MRGCWTVWARCLAGRLIRKNIRKRVIAMFVALRPSLRRPPLLQSLVLRWVDRPMHFLQRLRDHRSQHRNSPLLAVLQRQLQLIHRVQNDRSDQKLQIGARIALRVYTSAHSVASTVRQFADRHVLERQRLLPINRDDVFALLLRGQRHEQQQIQPTRLQQRGIQLLQMTSKPR